MRLDRYRRKSYKREIAYLFTCTLMFTGVTFGSYVATTSVEEENARVAAFWIEGTGDTGDTDTTITLGRELQDAASYYDDYVTVLDYEYDDDDEGGILLINDLETEGDENADVQPYAETGADAGNTVSDTGFKEEASYHFTVHGTNASETALRYYIELILEDDFTLPGGVEMELKHNGTILKATEESDDNVIYKFEDASQDVAPGQKIEDEYTLVFSANEQRLESSVSGKKIDIVIHAVQVD